MQAHEQPEPFAQSNTLIPEAEQMASVGAQLRQARQLAGVSIESLSVQLKVSVRNLESIEANDWQSLPDLVYARALIASICRHLKLNTQEMLQGVPLPPNTSRLLPQPAVDLSRNSLHLPDAVGAFRRFKAWLWVLLFGAALSALAWWTQHNPAALEQAQEQILRWSAATGLVSGPEQDDPSAASKASVAPANTVSNNPDLPQEQTTQAPVPAGHVVQDISPGGR